MTSQKQNNIYGESSNVNEKPVTTIFIDLDDSRKTLATHIMSIRETLRITPSEVPIYIYFIKGTSTRIDFDVSFLFDFIQSIENYNIVSLFRGYVEDSFLAAIFNKKFNMLYSSRCIFSIPGYYGEFSENVKRRFPDLTFDFF
jgi:hypothetical protein